MFRKEQRRHPSALDSFVDAIGLNPPDAQLFIYQGLLSKGRGIQLLIDIFQPGKRHIVYGIWPILEGTIRRAGRFNPKHSLPLRCGPDRVKEYGRADIGLSLYRRRVSVITCACQMEYAAYGVPSIVSDFPEMGRFIGLESSNADGNAFQNMWH